MKTLRYTKKTVLETPTNLLKKHHILHITPRIKRPLNCENLCSTLSIVSLGYLFLCAIFYDKNCISALKSSGFELHITGLII